jgi:hypothetical protein
LIHHVQLPRLSHLPDSCLPPGAAPLADASRREFADVSPLACNIPAQAALKVLPADDEYAAQQLVGLLARRGSTDKLRAGPMPVTATRPGGWLAGRGDIEGQPGPVRLVAAQRGRRAVRIRPRR